MFFDDDDTAWPVRHGALNEQTGEGEEISIASVLAFAVTVLVIGGAFIWLLVRFAG